MAYGKVGIRKLTTKSAKFEDAVAAYSYAVTTAAFIFTLLLNCFLLLKTGGFETATTNDIFTKTSHVLIMAVIFFVISWRFAFFTALVPFFVGIVLAMKLRLTHWLYFVGGSVLTSAALLPIFIAIPNLGINVQEPEPSFGQKYLSGLPMFIICGLVAGVACWRYLYRMHSKKEQTVLAGE